MNWIKLMVDVGDDPRLQRLADAAGVKLAHAVGCYALVLLRFPAHAETGDLSGIPDATLEQWARWDGKRGRFASAFRATCCNDVGVVAAWEKINGAAIRDSKAAVERARSWRQKKGERTTNVRHTNDVRTVLRDETRDKSTTGTTTRSKETAPLNTAEIAAPADKPKRTRKEPDYPALDQNAADVLYATWTAKIGAVPFARFRAAIGPLFAGTPDFTPSECLTAIEAYAAVSATPKELSFRSPELFARNYRHWLMLARLPIEKRAKHLPPAT